MPVEKARLGKKHTCFGCGTRFYDLNRPAPICPRCGTDQREAPEPVDPTARVLARYALGTDQGAPAPEDDLVDAEEPVMAELPEI